jgi:hypothetical protein
MKGGVIKMAPEEELHQLLQEVVDNAEVFERLVSSQSCGSIVREHLRECKECEQKRGVLLQKKMEELPVERQDRLAELGEQLVERLTSS